METSYRKRICSYFFDSRRFGLSLLTLGLICSTFLSIQSFFRLILFLLLCLGLYLFAFDFISTEDKYFYLLIFGLMLIHGIHLQTSIHRARSIKAEPDQLVPLELIKKEILFKTTRQQQFAIFETRQGVRVGIWLDEDKTNCKTLSGNFLVAKPETKRNPGGFAQDQYLAQFNCYLVSDLQTAEELRVVHSESGLKLIKDESYQAFASWLEKYFDARTSGFMMSFCFGQKQYIPDTLKQEFRVLGLQHILALSGFHFDLFLLPLLAFFRKKKSQSRVRLLISLPIIFCFLFLTDFPVGLIRAALVFILAELATLALIEIPKKNILLLIICFWLMISPFSILQLRFQLSFLASFIIYTILPYFKGTILETRPFLQSIVLSFVLQISIMPILLYHFGMWELSAIFLNYFLGLILLFFFFTGFFCLICFMLETLCSLAIGTGVMSFTAWLGRNFFRILEGFADSKVATYLVNYRQSFVTIGLLLLLITIVVNYIVRCHLYIFRKEKIKLKISLVLILFIAFGFTLFQQKIKNTWQIYFLDVGQGDCCLIVTPKKHALLIDSGITGKGYDVIIPAMQELGIRQIDYAIVSHWDEDHAGGIKDLLEHQLIETLIMPKHRVSNSAIFATEPRQSFQIPFDEQVRQIQVARGDQLNLQKLGLHFELLAPYSDIPGSAESDNWMSLCFALNIQGLSILFTGDLEQQIENKLLEDQILPDIDLLKVSHHGSKYGTGDLFLQAIRPEHAVISVGHNHYGHPHPDLIKRLEKQNISWHRTDFHGAIMLELTNDGWQISHYKNNNKDNE